MPIRKNESLILALLAYLAFDLLAHWHPGLRSSFDFLPRENGGDVNEFVNLWLAEFSRNVRELGFWKTFYLVNPWSAGGFYSSHPSLLTFLTAVWQNLFGEAPDTLRRLAILFFALRVGIFHSLIARSYGIAAARIALLLYLATPTTHTYPQALSFEVISGTFVLASFWAKRWWLRTILFACAALTDWTALFALPIFLWFAPKRFLSFALIALSVSLPFLWSKSFELATQESQVSRLWMYLIGPYHVLGSNPEALQMLLRAVMLSFPIPLLLFFFFDLFRCGVKNREPWFYACLFSGFCFLFVFLGVFRVHPYASQLLILPICAAAGRGFLEFSPKPWWRKGMLAVLIFAALFWNAYPFQSRESAEARNTFRLEAEKIAQLIKGKTYSIQSDLRYLRPEPLPLYLAGSLEKKQGCADFTVSYRAVEAEHPEAIFIGNFLLLKANSCSL